MPQTWGLEEVGKGRTGSPLHVQQDQPRRRLDWTRELCGNAGLHKCKRGHLFERPEEGMMADGEGAEHGLLTSKPLTF